MRDRSTQLRAHEFRQSQRILLGGAYQRQRFEDGPVLWSWSFVAGSAQVAYHTGPLHGEETSHCELHAVESGRLISMWEGDLDSDAKRPAWAKGLDH